MVKKQLDLNLPLLSVRRLSSLASQDGDSRTINEISIQRKGLPLYKSDLELGEVTKPAAVPFMWEQIPGRPKGGTRAQSQSPEEPSNSPCPPRRVLDVIKQFSKEVSKDQNVIRPHIKAPSLNDNATLLESSNKGTNADGDLDSQSEDDSYSDARDTLSPAESNSFNCSLSGLSGYDGPDVKPCGTFSADQQTRDFMMSRFLPAAKAMVVKTPQCVPRKQPLATEQPRQVKNVVTDKTRPLLEQYRSIIIPRGGQYEETEDEDDDSGNISAKACGLFPRFCLKNSLCLLSQVPGMKVRTRTALSSSTEASRLTKTAYGGYQSQIFDKHAWNAGHNRHVSAVQSHELLEVENKLIGESNRLSYSGNFRMTDESSPYRRSTDRGISPCRNFATQSQHAWNAGHKRYVSSVQSHELLEVENQLIGESNRLSYSGDLRMTDELSPYRRSMDRGISPYRNVATQSQHDWNAGHKGHVSAVQSRELLEVENKLIGESNRLSYSGDLRMADESSPYRHSKDRGISPYRNKLIGESNRSSYSGDFYMTDESSTYRRSMDRGISPYRNVATQSQHAWNAGHKRHVSSVQSHELLEVENKLIGESNRLSYSGDLRMTDESSPYRRSMDRGISPYRNVATKSQHAWNAGHKRHVSAVQSRELLEVENKLIGESNQLSYSGDSRMTDKSSPYRRFKDRGISPYRNVAPQSLFCEGTGFLGVPKVVDNAKPKNSKLCGKGSHNFRDVSSHQRNKQGSRSVSPLTEKTLYIDSVNTVKFISSEGKGPMGSSGEDFETLVNHKGMEGTSEAESSVQDIRCLNILEGGSILSTKASGFNNDYLSPSFNISDPKQAKGTERLRPDQSLNQESQSLEKLESPKVCSNGNLGMTSEHKLKSGLENSNVGSLQSLLPPPLPKSPSESWLWRALPSISSQNSFSNLHSGSQFHPKKQCSDTSSNSTKWETIVKTYNLHYDHVRCSEEPIPYASQHFKT